MRPYPFTPAILDALPEELAELFRGLELTLLEEICSRLNLANQLNEVTVQDIRALRAHGIDLSSIKKAIRGVTGVSREKLDKLLDDVVERNEAYYGNLATLAHITTPEHLVNHEDIRAIYEQTREELRNITRSMGFLVKTGRHTSLLKPAKAYQFALDSAVLEIESGGVSYNEAITRAVKKLADSGLKAVDFESGHVDHVDVAVRRAVMTGVNQLCDKYVEQSMEAIGTRYCEISAHVGARDICRDPMRPWQDHKSWQGKVYYESEYGEPDPRGEYQDLREVTGFGEVDGLTGANCRHHRYSFVPGVSERTYTDEQLSHIDDKHDCWFEGRHYTAYEATQKQREIERTIRKLKRRKAAWEATGTLEAAKEAELVNIRIRTLSGKYSAFSKAADLPEQRERMKAYEPNGPSTPVEKAVEKTAVRGTIEAVPKSGGESVKRANYTDVTQEYFDNATPNSHVVQDLHEYTVNGVTYSVDGHNVQLSPSPHEREIAELLEQKLGGELYMVPRMNIPQSVRTPDYLFRGRSLDLKTLEQPAGENTIFNKAKKSAGQAKNIVVDITKGELDDETVESQIRKIFWSDNTAFIDEVIIIKGQEIIKIAKRV